MLEYSQSQLLTVVARSVADIDADTFTGTFLTFRLVASLRTPRFQTS